MAKYNKNYGNLDENKALIYAPVPLLIDGIKIWTNIPEKYIGQGYYPIKMAERPKKEGFYYTSFYELENETVVRKWNEHKIETDSSEAV